MFSQYQEYFRAELVAFVGSKQNQSGIIWGQARPNCIIVTSGGKHGDTAGYSDRKLSDGSWRYIGQGSTGDQSPANYANALLINGNHDVLLFTTREPTTKEFKTRGTRSKLYKFEGLFKVGFWQFVIPDKGKRAGNRLIELHLLPARNIYSSGNNEEEIRPLESNSAGETTEDANAQQGKRLALVEFRRRSQLVKNYALKRANGVCEHCGSDAPFITISNIPFLEVHHIFSLADDGPDDPQNVAAVCPNCHRWLHFGIDTERLNLALHKRVAEKEVKK